MSAFKEYCALSFVKGSLLDDPAGILVSPGPNSRATRQIRITDGRSANKLAATIVEYVNQAIAIEKAGLKVELDKAPPPLPDELTQKFNELPELEQAFHALTPGRQRAYILFISGAKQAKTRVGRVEKNLARILAGKGLND